VSKFLRTMDLMSARMVVRSWSGQLTPGVVPNARDFTSGGGISHSLHLRCLGVNDSPQGTQRNTGYSHLHMRSLLRRKGGSVGMTPRFPGLGLPDLGMEWSGWVDWIGNCWWAALAWSHFCSGRFLSKGYASHREIKTVEKCRAQN